MMHYAFLFIIIFIAVICLYPIQYALKLILIKESDYGPRTLVRNESGSPIFLSFFMRVMCMCTNRCLPIFINRIVCDLRCPRE